MFNENSRVKISALLHLIKLGYKYLSLQNATIDPKTNIFTDIFNESISRINNDLDADFSLHSATARKLKREGLLHGRELKRQDGTVYCTIYLMSENKEFLEKYPRKPRIKIEWKMKDDKENEVKL